MDKNKRSILKKLLQIWGEEASILKYVNNWEYIEYKDASAVVFINDDIKESKNEKIAFFGFIRFPNETESALWLFKKISEEAKKLGATRLVGPLNYSTWFSYRWMTEGWNKVRTWPEPNNERYMPEVVKQLGFTEYIKYFSSIIPVSNDEKHKKSKKKYENALSEGFKFKRYKGRKIKSILNKIYKISTEVFADKPLYSPISRIMFKKIYVSSFKKIDPIVDLCLYKNKPVGFSFFYENPYEKKILLWKTVALKKEYQGYGLGSAFRYLVHQYAIENNKSYVMQLLMHVESKSKQLIVDGKVIKKFALFSKKI